MINNERAMLWVYNKETGSLTRKMLTYHLNEMEDWFQDKKYHTYDPFYVSDNKQLLVNKVANNLACELQETLNNAERILRFMSKLRKKA